MRAVQQGKAAGGYAPALECGGLRCAPASLRCSGREGGCGTRPRTAATPLRGAAVLGARTVLAGAPPRGDAQPSRPCAPRRRICRCRRTPTHSFASTTVACAVEYSERLCAVGGTRCGRLVGRRASQQRARHARRACFV